VLLNSILLTVWINMGIFLDASVPAVVFVVSVHWYLHPGNICSLQKLFSNVFWAQNAFLQSIMPSTFTSHLVIDRLNRPSSIGEEYEPVS
jgi:hypothetical protein